MSRNQILPVQSLVSDIPAGVEKIANFYSQCTFILATVIEARQKGYTVQIYSRQAILLGDIMLDIGVYRTNDNLS